MHRSLVPIILAVVLVACSSSDPAPDTDQASDVADESPAAAPADDESPTAPAEDEPVADEETPPAPPSEETCGDPATIVDFGAATAGDATDGGPVYFCVEVPSGQASVEFELTDLVADLDLYVAYDTFDELGGGFALRSSGNNGTEAESITIEPSVYAGELLGVDSYADVSPGPYWIEVVGATGDPSTFTLSITGTSQSE